MTDTPVSHAAAIGATAATTATSTNTRAMFDSVVEHNNLGVTQLHAGHHREAIIHLQCAIQSLRNLVKLIKQANQKLQRRTPGSGNQSSRNMMMSMNYNWCWFSAQGIHEDSSSVSCNTTTTTTTTTPAQPRSQRVDDYGESDCDDDNNYDDDDNGFVFHRAVWISTRLPISSGAGGTKRTRISSVTSMSTILLFNMGLAFHVLATGVSSVTSVSSSPLIDLEDAPSASSSATVDDDSASSGLPSALDMNYNRKKCKFRILQNALRCYRASVDIRNKSNQVNATTNNDNQEYHRHYYQHQYQLVLFDLALLNNIAVIHRELRDYKEAVVWYRILSQTVHGLNAAMMSLVTAHNDFAKYYFARMMASWSYYRWQHLRGAAAA